MNDQQSPETSVVQALDSAIAHELHSLKKHWWSLLAVGIILVICGVTAIAFPFLSTMGIAVTLGVLLLVGGITTVVSAFWASDWGAFVLQLLIGIIYTLLGLAIAEEPVISSAALTMLVGAFAIVGGSVRVIASMTIRFPQWGWVMLNGIIALIFGVVIFHHFPESSLVLLGIMLGIDMIFAGLAWTMLAFELRELNESDSTS